MTGTSMEMHQTLIFLIGLLPESLTSSWHPSYWRSSKRWSKKTPRCFIIFYSFRKFLFRICHWKLLHHHLRQPQWRSLWFVLHYSCWWELF